jgi:N utilization substance protein B
MSNRHLARTLALQSLFEWDFHGMPKEEVDKILKYNFKEFAPDFDDQGFAKNLLNGTIENLVKIDELIVLYAPEWPLDQITGVDRNVLRLGIYELKFSPNIPPKVAINESIELAKSFGGDASGKFINGVLGSIYKEMQQKGEKQGMDQPVLGERQFSAGGIVWRRFSDNDIKVALILDGHNRWTFSKGRIKPNEDPVTAVQREIGEELGLKNLIIGQKIGELELVVREPNVQPYPKTVYIYLIEAKDGDISPAQNVGEMKDAKWYDYDEVDGVLGYDQAKELWQKAKNIIINF